jgi:transcriptional regulator with XRE-family HTH domain
MLRHRLLYYNYKLDGDLMKFSVGQRLRQVRIEQGLDCETVAARTKIPIRYLNAIENDDRSTFPSGFFYKSFVHQYAEALSLDTSEIDAEISEMLSADAPLPLPGYHDVALTTLPPMVSSSRTSRRRTYASLAVLAVAIAGCSGFYAWWRKIDLAPRTQTAKQIAKPGSQPLTPPVTVRAAAPPSAAAPADASPLRTTSPEYKVLLDLIAREKTWLSASSDGKVVFQGILAPNETKTIEGREFARLRVGNAAGIDVRLNGKEVGPLGTRGQVLDVLFRPDNFEILQPATKESD